MSVQFSMANAVAVENLSRQFRDFWGRPKVNAVAEVSFTVAAGEIFGLLGPNGSGKTTTLKMMLGLLRPDCGAVRIFGLPPEHPQVRARIGYLPEENYLYPQLTAEETLDFYGRLFDLPPAECRRRGAYLLQLTGLFDARRRRVGEFSKGMARRLGLAQALINDPDVLVLDEPTAGLDPLGCRQVKDILLDLSRRGKTVIFSSHLLADVEDVCRRILIMYQGRIIKQGTVAGLLEDIKFCRVTFPAPASETMAQIMAALRAVLKEEAQIDRPRRTLEQIFLETIQQAQQPAENQTAAGGKPTEDMSDPNQRLRDLVHFSP